jgi:cell division protein FtsW (lipid II flippase)
MIDRRLFTHIEWLTLALTVALAVAGMATVYSATHSQSLDIPQRGLLGDTRRVHDHAVIINYIWIERLAYFIYGSTICLLVSVFIIGHAAGGPKGGSPGVLYPAAFGCETRPHNHAGRYFSTESFPNRA